MRLQPNKVNWIGRPGTDVVTTLRLNTSLDLHISLNVVHTNISQERKHVTVSRVEISQKGYSFTCNWTIIIFFFVLWSQILLSRLGPGSSPSQSQNSKKDQSWHCNLRYTHHPTTFCKEVVEVLEEGRGLRVPRTKISQSHIQIRAWL